MNDDHDFPATSPALHIGMIDPTAIRLAEAAELQRLKNAVAKQKGMEPAPCWTIDQCTPESEAGPMIVFTLLLESTEARGAQDGSAMGYVSKEEAGLSRFQRLMAYRTKRREEYRAFARKVFVANRAIDVMTFSAFVKAGKRLTGRV